ncbi:alpha/beta hydrolase [Sphingomonas sabuli]|uniref:alpha/beta hydrolase n=1 Tax=Sphingomonas sabuli TaxID=2764186 RepID=UPI001CA3FBAD|nr:alpha/beta hydrolase [Sphingomonas sabuli]
MALLGVAGLVVAAFLLSPWPSILIIRAVFDRGAASASQKLEKHVPQDVTVRTFRYAPNYKHALLDIYRSANTPQGSPLIVWVHGGGFVSGARGNVANYAKVLAGRGFTVANVDYTIAPDAIYPTPIRQVSKALAFLQANQARLGIDARRIVLAGDSAGAQIAAQTAAITVDPAYASRVGVRGEVFPAAIAGVLLYCGVYDVTELGGGGVLGWFVGSTTWAYSGKRNWRDAKGFDTISVVGNVTGAFPPAFISAGNADPLGPQSVALAKALKARTGKVETLFFPPDYAPPLGHEYQFDLDIPAGRLALERSVGWLKALPARP